MIYLYTTLASCLLFTASYANELIAKNQPEQQQPVKIQTDSAAKVQQQLNAITQRLKKLEAFDERVKSRLLWLDRED